MFSFFTISQPVLDVRGTKLNIYSNILYILWFLNIGRWEHLNLAQNWATRTRQSKYGMYIVGRSLPTYFTYLHIISRIFISNFISNIKPIIRICTLLRIFIHFMILGTWVLCNTPESKVLGPTWGPTGSCLPQMGPMLAPWTLLSGTLSSHLNQGMDVKITQLGASPLLFIASC